MCSVAPSPDSLSRLSAPLIRNQTCSTALFELGTRFGSHPSVPTNVVQHSIVLYCTALNMLFELNK